MQVRNYGVGAVLSQTEADGLEHPDHRTLQWLSYSMLKIKTVA